MPDSAPFRVWDEYSRYNTEEMRARSNDFYEFIKKRRSVRSFSSKKVPIDVLDKCIKSAGTAPNGANKQPWHFVVITDPLIKKKLRIAAEKEEYLFYNGRATQEWLQDLEAFQTTEEKPFLEEAPALIAIFSASYTRKDDGTKEKHYYVKESVGIATGILITALHNAGLATLTHTPSPMGFLNKVLDRPSNEKAFLLLVCGFPEKDVQVPDIEKKPLDEIRTII
ncbi:MAG: nitroreductase family protein [Balneola sp.]|nr:nitroreductase family protein [Balneola sp.]|tara:strand:+ start:8403 stop:9074 length:672 start_codon:yes stop_codon:yes gene_type:complete